MSDKVSAQLRGKTVFSVLVTQTPTLICGGNERWAIVFLTDTEIFIGAGTGSCVMQLPADTLYTDNYTSDPWYGRATAGASGTVSGWYV